VDDIWKLEKELTFGTAMDSAANRTFDGIVHGLLSNVRVERAARGRASAPQAR